MQGNDRVAARGAADLWESVPDAGFRLDREGRFAYVNRAAAVLLEEDAAALLGRSGRECIPWLHGSSQEARYDAVLATGRPGGYEVHSEHTDRWYEIRLFPDADGVTVLVRDVDDRRRTEERRDAQLRDVAAALEALPSPTVLVGTDGRILLGNHAWVRSGELLASPAQAGRAGDRYLTVMERGLDSHDVAVLAAGLQQVADGTASTFQLDYSCATTGGRAWFHLQAASVQDTGQTVVTHTEVTERVLAQRELVWQADHDDLTGLPNRSRLLALLRDALAGLDREGTAVLLLDLDGFKTINDSLGHGIGDSLLRRVGTRLAEQVRPGDEVGRLGGDQFVVLAGGCDASEAAALAFRLQRAFGMPFQTDGISIPLTASIGVAVARPDIQDAHELLGDADSAMFAAKSSGRDRVHLFSPALRAAARWRLEVATRLREDVVDQLVIHYQPVVRLDDGTVEGVEALVRWQHPDRGLLPPDTFLGVAEETGQVIPITRWLLRQTTRQAAAWAAEGLPLRMSVNVSARHFAAETLVRDVRVALRESGLPPDQLVLELTETSVAEDPTRAEDQLTVLRSFGVRVAIDDFGTGWSSLAQLFALPIGTLKIDRSLLAAAEHAVSGESGAVLAAIVGLARTLGIRSVAEGVETLEHLQLVRAAGCDLAQGWLLSKPMPAVAVPGWVRSVQSAGGDLCALVASGRGVSSGG